MQIDEYYSSCPRKRKRDYNINYYNHRKRKFEEDLDNIIINKFNKIEILDNKYINNKKRICDDIVDDININLNINKQKIKKTYNCRLHEHTKEICLIYNCSGNININDNINDNVVYNYIK